MKNWWNKMKARMQSAMDGRYGSDELTQFLISVAFVILLVSLVPKLRFLYMRIGLTQQGTRCSDSP